MTYKSSPRQISAIHWSLTFYPDASETDMAKKTKKKNHIIKFWNSFEIPVPAAALV